MTQQELEQFRRRLEESRATILETLSTSLESAKGEELDPTRVGRLSRMDARVPLLLSRGILNAR
jgi:hypothetical protein